MANTVSLGPPVKQGEGAVQTGVATIDTDADLLIEIGWMPSFVMLFRNTDGSPSMALVPVYQQTVAQNFACMYITTAATYTTGIYVTGYAGDEDTGARPGFIIEAAYLTGAETVLFVAFR